MPAKAHRDTLRTSARDGATVTEFDWSTPYTIITISVIDPFSDRTMFGRKFWLRLAQSCRCGS